MRRFLRLYLIVFAGLSLTSCENSQMATSSEATSRFAAAPADRPGLGTKWGETRASRVELTGFARATSQPLATGAIYYNNAAGIQAMTGSRGWYGGWAMLPPTLQSMVEVGLRDESGRMLRGVMANGRWFVVGEEGRRYSIVVRNRSDMRLELVASVDGLDVIDGRKASYSKRGYLMQPRSNLVIDGFRQSTEAIAAFRFGSVRESYAAQKHHDTRNVGVIGIALFNERGTNPFSNEETQRRLKANPFPNRFATPPQN